MQRIYAFAGQNKSGKSAAAAIVRERHPCAVSIRFSDSLRDVATRLLTAGLPPGQALPCDPKTLEMFRSIVEDVYAAASPARMELALGHLAQAGVPLLVSREFLQELSTALRTHLGEDIIAKGVVARIKAAPIPIVIIEGVRRLADVAPFRDVPGFSLCYINASLRVRYERSIAQGENVGDATMSEEEFRIRDMQESEREIASLLPLADMVIENNQNDPGLLVQAINAFLWKFPPSISPSSIDDTCP